MEPWERAGLVWRAVDWGGRCVNLHQGRSSLFIMFFDIFPANNLWILMKNIYLFMSVSNLVQILTNTRM